jgi:hypothetical protein
VILSEGGMEGGFAIYAQKERLDLVCTTVCFPWYSFTDSDVIITFEVTREIANRIKSINPRIYYTYQFWHQKLFI